MSASFAEDVALLAERGEGVVLVSEDGGQRVLVAPLYQGRVMTSTLDGEGGRSLGWVNREQMRSGARTPHMTVWGGEDRFWVGPEGGQHGIYFPPGAPFDFERWQVPEALDWGAWELVRADRSRAQLCQHAHFASRSGTRFEALLEREVRLLGRREIGALLGAELEDRVDAVGFQSDNQLENIGAEPWTRRSGLLSIWILGMFPASDTCTLAVPFQKGSERELGPVARSDYFHLPGADRLAVERRKAVLFFRGDGLLRSKLGVPRPRARPWLGSWDWSSGVLTLVHCDLALEGSDYVDSRWMEQRDPYDGDVVNVYNDGPPDAAAAAKGSFYELETSSAVHPLAPGEHLRHVHRTLHLSGPEGALDEAALAALGVRLAEIRSALS